MSHIQGQPHTEGTTEHLDCIRIDVDLQGAVAQLTVVTHHSVAGLNLPSQITIYKAAPGPGDRDVGATLSTTRLSQLRGILTALAAAVAAADTPQDPAPPRPQGDGA